MRPSSSAPSRVCPSRLLCLCAGLALVGEARADNLVAVLSSAAPDYLLNRMEGDKRKPQSYVFMEGTYHEGAMRDGSLEKMKFGDIVQRIAQDLKTQAFYPAKSVEEADLLLVVHWGTTVRRPGMDEMMGHTGDEHRQYVMDYKNAQTAVDDAVAHPDVPVADPFSLDGAVLQARDAQNFDSLMTQQESMDASMAGASNARLLGITGELQRENDKIWDSEEGKTLRGMLDEERYFIAVIAYDCSELIKNKKLKRVWSTRMNIRSPGVNFFIALNRMSDIGGHFFGTTIEGLKIAPAHEKKTQVEIGRLIVIESTAGR